MGEFLGKKHLSDFEQVWSIRGRYQLDWWLATTWYGIP